MVFEALMDRAPHLETLREPFVQGDEEYHEGSYLRGEQGIHSRLDLQATSLEIVVGVPLDKVK